MTAQRKALTKKKWEVIWAILWPHVPVYLESRIKRLVNQALRREGRK